MNICEVFIVL